MFARVVIFENVEFPAADDAVEWMRREAVPAARRLRGFRAASVVLSRESRRMLVTTYFESLADVRAAEPAFASTGETMPGLLREAVERWVVSAEVVEVPLSESIGAL